MAKNSRNESYLDMTVSNQFSPVSKPTTPKVNQGRNLTGTARHVRDLAADIHAYIQHWNTKHLQGFTILKNITEEKQDDTYSQELQELCDELDHICNDLDMVVKSLGQITQQLKVIATLNKDSDILFMMWPSTKFGHVAELIYNAYHRENRLKRKILEEVAHNHKEPWKMLCLATWAHQPLLPDNVTSLLESLLLETGHR